MTKDEFMRNLQNLKKMQPKEALFILMTFGVAIALFVFWKML